MRWLILLLLFLVSCVEGTGDLAPISGNIQDNPYITNVSIPSGSYSVGDNLLFTVTFSEPVSVSGNPLLNFSTDSNTYSATYVGGSETKYLIFRFPVGVGMTDTDGIRVQSPLIPNSGSLISVQDLEAASLSFSSYKTGALIPSSGGGGGTTPFITAFTASPASLQASGYYERGMRYFIDVTFDQIVLVTGTPGLNIRIGTNDGTDAISNLNYASGSGTTKLRFSGIVSTTNLDSDGVRLDTDTPQLTVNASNSIKSTSGVDIDPRYTSPGAFATLLLDGSLGPDLDATPINTPDPDVVYKEGDTLEFILNFDRQVRVQGGTPHLDINVGGVARSASWVSDGGNYTATQRFQYVVGDSNFDVDLDGVEVTGVSYNSAGFYDAQGAVAAEIPDTDIDGPTGAKVASAEVLNWYDLSSPLTVTNSTSFLNTFNDIMGIKNGSLSAADIPYSTGFVDFRVNDYVRINSVAQNAYVLLVYITGATNGPGPLLYDYTSGQNLLVAPAGGTRNLSSSVACNNANCSYIDSAGNWQTGSGVLAGVTTAAFSKQVVVFKLNRASSLDLQIANASSFWFFEMLLIDGSVSQAAIKAVASDLAAKQGASF